MGLIEIKTLEPNFNVKIAKIVRKYRDISISEIKRIVSEKENLFDCDYTDENGIKIVLSLHDELAKEGIATVMYEHQKATTVEFLNNLLSMYEEIDEQVEEDINEEALTNEEDYDDNRY